MDQLRYRIDSWEAVGAELKLVSSVAHESTLFELFFVQLAAAWFGIAPPLEVLNRLTSRGDVELESHGGLTSWSWDPFTMNPREYHALLDHLERHPDPKLRRLDPPPEVSMPDGWDHWAFVQALHRISESHRTGFPDD